VQIVVALYFATILSFDTRLRNLFKGILLQTDRLAPAAEADVGLVTLLPGESRTVSRSRTSPGPSRSRSPRWARSPMISPRGIVEDLEIATLNSLGKLQTP
jgi:hypothetical protein